MQICSATLVFPTDPPGGGQWNLGLENDKKRDVERREPLRILVVDDEATIANTLVQILSAEGYEVVAASTGGTAVAIAKSFRPNVLLSDVVMPALNGVEAAIQIQKNFPDCRILLFSGQMETVDLLRDARERGYEFEIVAKPIKPRALLSLIRNKPT